MEFSFAGVAYEAVGVQKARLRLNPFGFWLVWRWFETLPFKGQNPRTTE